MGFFDFIIPDSIWSLEPTIGPLRSATKAARDQTPDWAVGPIKSITSIISAYYFSTPLNDAINDYTWPGPDTESLSPGNLGTLDTAAGIKANKTSNNGVIPVVYGERGGVGGNVVFLSTGGTDNEYLYLAIAVSEGEIDEITSVEFDGYEIDLTTDTDGSGNVNTGRYDGLAYIMPYVGTDTQAADSILMNADGWTSNHRLLGTAYLAIRLKVDNEVYAKIPSITSSGRWKLVYNATTSVTEFSRNPVWCVRDYLTNTRYGRGISSDEIDDILGSTFRTEAITCDTLVTVAGVSAAQYSCDGVLDPSKNDIDNISTMLTSCRGILIYSGGLYKFIIDKLVTPSSFEFNEDNILGSWSIKLSSKKTLFNRIKVNFYNPDRKWESDVVIEDNPTYRTADNEQLLEKTVTLPFTKNRDRALYIAEQDLRQSRQGLVCEFQSTIAGLVAEIGDVVPITHNRPGWDQKPFRILGVKLRDDDECIITAVEYSDSVYDPNTVVAGDPAPNTNLPNPFSVEPPSGLLATETVLEEGLSVTNRLTLTWTPSPDAFVKNYSVAYKLSSDSVWIEHNDKPEFDRLDGSSKIYSYIDGLAIGTYDFRVKANNVHDVPSVWVTITSQFIEGSDTAPAAPANVAIITNMAALDITWDANTEADLDGYIIYRHTSNVPGSATEIASVTTTGRIASNLTNGLFFKDRPTDFATYYYWITAVDKAGNESTKSTVASGGLLQVKEGDVEDGAITVGKMTVAELSAIVADLGSMTAGDITLDTLGFIRGGQTAYNTGTGFFLGYSGGAYKFSIGDGTNYVTWDGSELAIAGTINGVVVGDFIEAEFTTSSPTAATTSYTIMREFVIGRGGTYRIKAFSGGSGGSSGTFIQVWKNGVAHGSEHAVVIGGTNTSDDLAFESGDSCEIRGKAAVGTVTNFSSSVNVGNPIQSITN